MFDPACEIEIYYCIYNVRRYKHVADGTKDGVFNVQDNKKKCSGGVPARELSKKAAITHETPLTLSFSFPMLISHLHDANLRLEVRIDRHGGTKNPKADECATPRYNQR